MNIREHVQHARSLRPGLVNGTIDRSLYALGRQTEMFADIDPSAKKNLDSFCEKIQSGAFPVVIFNHQSFVDPILVAPLIRYIRARTRIECFRIPVAQTLLDGTQGKSAKFLFDLFNPTMRTNGIAMFGAIRDEDEEMYGAEEIKENQKRNREIMKKMEENNEGFIIAPEGTLRGGRNREDAPGKVQGIQEVRDTGINSIIARRISRGQPTVIMSVAIEGSFRIADPDTKKAGEGAWIDMLRTRKRLRAHLTTTPPITNESILEHIGISNPKEAGMYLLRNPNVFFGMTLGEIAKYLPEDQQGVWKDKSKCKV